MQHIALLGDSIFDNGVYVYNGLDVIGHFKRILPQGCKVTLCARDGSSIAEIPRQIQRLPNDVTFIAVSVGGNDVLLHYDLINPQSGRRNVLEEMDFILTKFHEEYRSAIQQVKSLGKPMLICTIYNGNLPVEQSAAAKSALAAFNDKIYWVANELMVPVLELRGICTEEDDYANGIEPSAKGGGKIAQAILCGMQRLAG